mgnify:CR=1 FL=1
MKELFFDYVHKVLNLSDNPYQVLKQTESSFHISSDRFLIHLAYHNELSEICKHLEPSTFCFHQQSYLKNGNLYSTRYKCIIPYQDEHALMLSFQSVEQSRLRENFLIETYILNKERRRVDVVSEETVGVSDRALLNDLETTIHSTLLSSKEFRLLHATGLFQ